MFCWGIQLECVIVGLSSLHLHEPIPHSPCLLIYLNISSCFCFSGDSCEGGVWPPRSRALKLFLTLLGRRGKNKIKTVQVVMCVCPLGGELTSWNFREVSLVRGLQTWREEWREKEHVSLVATAGTTSCCLTMEDSTVRPQAAAQSPLPTFLSFSHTHLLYMPASLTCLVIRLPLAKIEAQW